MPLSRTLAELREDFRNEGGFQESRVFTDAVVAGFINVGVAAAYDIMVDARADYFAKMQQLDSFSNGRVQLSFLDHNFYRLLRLDLFDGGTFCRLRRVQGVDLDGLIPLTRERTVRITYVPTAPRLSLDGDCFSHFGVRIAEDLVTFVALRRAYVHEERATAALDAEIALLEERVKAAGSRRDQHEPQTMSDFDWAGQTGIRYWMAGDEIHLMESDGWAT